MKNAKCKTIPNCLRRYRKAKALKQKEVAQILGLKSASQISRWERGFCMPSSLNLLKRSLVYRPMVDALFIDLLRSPKMDLQTREEELEGLLKGKQLTALLGKQLPPPVCGTS